MTELGGGIVVCRGRWSMVLFEYTLVFYDYLLLLDGLWCEFWLDCANVWMCAAVDSIMRVILGGSGAYLVVSIVLWIMPYTFWRV